jgi:divalent metal cation (Fe/Co/Zn/Cd) transporter
LRGRRPFFSWLKRTRKAELVVVLGEDCAALAGLAMAFGFLLAATITGNPAFDALGSIAVGAVLIGVAVFVAVRIHSFLIGTRAEEELEEAIRTRALAASGITAVHELVTLQLGGQVMLSIKVGMAPELGIAAAVERINDLERAVKAEFPEIRFTFVEPDSGPGGD